MATTTSGREPGDPYWLIVHVDEDDETSRWFARSLRVSGDGGPYGDADADSPEDGSFICDFVDW